MDNPETIGVGQNLTTESGIEEQRNTFSNPEYQEMPQVTDTEPVPTARKEFDRERKRKVNKRKGQWSTVHSSIDRQSMPYNDYMAPMPLVGGGISKGFKKAKKSPRIIRDSVTPIQTDKIASEIQYGSQSARAHDAAPITLNQVRKNRQSIETDVLKMHNRIKMLQQEEDRALKKIEETRKRADHILQVKQSQTQLHEREKVKEEQLRQLRESIVDRKDKQKKQLETSYQKYIMSKQMEVSDTKKEKTRLKKMKERNELAHLKEAQERRVEIRYKAEIAQQKIEEMKQKKIIETQKEKEKETQRESQSIKHKESEQKKLSKIENDLIERLKVTQNKQKEADEVVQEALKLEVKPKRNANKSKLKENEVIPIPVTDVNIDQKEDGVVCDEFVIEEKEEI